MITLSVADASLYSCTAALRTENWAGTSQLTSGDWKTMLLPSTGEWDFAQSVEGFGMEQASGSSVSVCTLRVRVRRNWIIFTIKQTFLIILVVYGGLLAMLLTPGEQTGDKTALIMLSVVVVILSLQLDLGLGRLQYLIWFDWFNLVQM